MYFHWVLHDGRRRVTLAHTEAWAQTRMRGRKTRAAVREKKRGDGGGGQKTRKKYKKRATEKQDEREKE